MMLSKSEACNSAIQAIESAIRNANSEWLDTATEVGEQLARRHALLTSANIDMQMMYEFPQITTHEKRAMAGVMRRLKTAKVLEPTAQFTTDPRENCHGQNKRVWRSLIYEGMAA